MEFLPIGTIETPFKDREGMPIQPSGAKGIKGKIHIDPAYEQGLADIDGFSHLILLYHFHKSKGFDLMVTPFLDKTQRGGVCHPGTKASQRHRPVHRPAHVPERQYIGNTRY